MSNNSEEEKTSQEMVSYENITGNILYNMTNDYMFCKRIKRFWKVLSVLYYIYHRLIYNHLK